MSVDHEVVIVGAGFGGIGAAIALKRRGIDDLLIVDREDDLGGTWHVNHYPGLAVDIASVTYSYSFEPNPYWSRLFAPGNEIKRYAAHVADKYDVRRHMRFGVTVESARWDNEAQQWQLGFSGGETVSARYLVVATGFLSQPQVPDIPGINDFAGAVIHTADWDDTHDLTGERVAVLGTGATSVQLVPKLAKQVGRLTVFQRTPIWVVPKLDFPIPPRVQQVFARWPLTQRAARLVSSTVFEALLVIGVLHFKQAHRFNKRAERLARKHLHKSVPDPELRAKLTPDYDFGCKRPTISNSYYRTFTKPNVDLETTPIDRFDPDGVITTDGRHTEIDTLVLATGFNIWDANFPAFEILGRDGRNLGKWWRENRFQAYQGVAVPGFPNLACLSSPYGYSGLSYFSTIEYQMEHLDRLFGELQRRGSRTFEITEAACNAYLDRMTDRLADSVFILGQCATANSYYFNDDGEPALLRPTSTLNARREAKRFPLDDYAYSA
jgi:cation diffusion facilitator CzcD-associated flavoprotein CzcO